MGGFLWEPESLEKDVFIALSGNSRRTPEDDASFGDENNVSTASLEKPQRTMEDVQAYASFGDDGTTVTVNRYGNIMQISRFLEFGPSGFLCVDPRLYNSYWVQDRMEDLVDTLKDRKKGLRLELVEWSEFENLPSLGFMYDRWPRYIFKLKGLEEPKTHSTDHPVSNATADSSTQTSNDLGTATTPKDNTDKSAAFPLSIQYFCSRGIVIQKYLLNIGEGGIGPEKVNWGNLSLAPDVCIRSLDFVKHQDRGDFREKLKFSVVSDHHLILQHKKDSQTGAALVISAFINDEPTKIDKNHCINLEHTDGQLEISVIYKLVILQKDTIEVLENLEKDPSAYRTEPTLEESDTETNSSAEDEAIPEAAENASKRVRWIFTDGRRTRSAMKRMKKIFRATNPFRKIYFAQDIRLDYAFRRNLEHILSVCSIPVYAGPLKLPSIAITCGDIAGHRVDSRSSLSAVQFLCSMLKYLDPHDKESGKDRFKNKKAHFKANGGPSTSETPISDAGDEAATQESDDPDEEYLEKLHERVRRVIRGHLQWISTQTECWKDGTFAPHYWPTGRRIDDLDYLSSPSLIDTPLQLLKVYHILDLEPREKNQQPMTMREYFAKENKDKEQDWLVAELQPKVRSWIEEMHAGNERGTYTFSRKPKRNQDYDSDDDENREPKYCLTDHVMIGMALKCVEKLKMPTEDENDVTRQQAQETISRSNNAKKPWCYYIYDEVRSKTLKRFTVVNTVANQRMFATSRRSDDTRFLLHSKDTYLFFAANMEYFKGPKAPSSREPKDAKSSKLADAWRRADDRWTKLLDAQSNYDEFRHSEWKKPLWYAIAFVLGNMGKPVTGEWSEKEAKTPNLILLEPSWYNGLFPGRLGKQGKPALHERESGRDEYWFSTFELPNVLWTFRLGEATMGSGKPVEKHTNFVNLSHPKDKIEPKIVLDDWLQRPPAILDFTSEPDSVPPQAEDADTDKRVDKIFDGFNNELPQSRLGVIIDVPRYSLGYELSKNQIDKSACFALKTQRTVWESKKRIIWLSVRNSDVAKKVYEATRGIEKETVLSFLRRNSNFDTYFHDSATAALNLWETELHLSFFRPSELEGEVLDCMEGTRLAFTTMSLRFSGDFSDRYWTCYFLEHGTHDRKKETAGAHATQDGKQKASGEHATQDSNTATLGLRLVPREEDCIIGGNLDLKLSGQDLVQALKELRNPDQNLAQALEELGCSVQGLLQAFNELECSAQDIVQALEELGRGSGQDVIQAFEQLGCTVRDLVQTLKELGYPARDVVQSLKELGYPAQDIRQAFEDLEYPLQDIRLPRERLRDSVEDNGPALQGLESRGLEPGVRRKLRASAKRMKKDSMFLRAWQQRRVLELLMFSKMLQELHESTTQVLQLIKRLALQSDKLQNLDSKYQLFATAVEEAKQLQKVGVEDDYDSISAKWREYGQILVVVEENLTDNIERIKQWDRREKDRQNEQPRWTDQDKRNHAATILRLRILCERQAIEIDRLKNDVMAFRDSLPNRLETIRNDIAFRDSQNINLFTYVTVVFLPLGFAAGILSMNGAPDHHLLMNLVTLALGALGITLFALLNAQIVKTMVSPLIDGYWALTHTLFLWQFAKYTFFHVITRRAIEKRAGKTSTHRQSDNKQESPAPISASTRKNDLRRRWQQKYDEIRKFRYREARLKLEKSLDSKDTDEITTVPQEPSPPQPDIKDSSHRSGEEMV